MCILSELFSNYRYWGWSISPGKRESITNPMNWKNFILAISLKALLHSRWHFDACILLLEAHCKCWRRAFSVMSKCQQSWTFSKVQNHKVSCSHIALDEVWFASIHILVMNKCKVRRTRKRFILYQKWLTTSYIGVLLWHSSVLIQKAFKALFLKVPRLQMFYFDWEPYLGEKNDERKKKYFPRSKFSNT